MSALLCQSVARAEPRFRPFGFPCEYRARHVLCGVHLCAHHLKGWETRLRTGEKIRIHPERALPLDHTCPFTPVPPPPLPPPQPVAEPGSKWCPACRRDLPRSAFAKHAKRPDGLQAQCRSCMSRYWRKSPESGSPTSPPVPEPEPEAHADSEPELDVSVEGQASWPTHAIQRLRYTKPCPQGCGNRCDRNATQCRACQVARMVAPPPPSPPPPPRPEPDTHRRTERDEDDEPAEGPLPYVYLHEIICGLCGRRLGDVQAASSTAAVALPDVKCPHCGGFPQRSGEVGRRLLIERDLVRNDRPRRGRPPRALVEARALERGAA